MMGFTRSGSVLRAVALSGAVLLSCARAPSSRGTPAAPATESGGPPRGSVIVVGGGSQGPEILTKFIERAGGPDALILDVPTAGGADVYPADWRGQNALRAAGAKNVVVLHTKQRDVANSDSIVALINRAGGVWFEGGRHFHLVDSYLGTRAERAFHDVLARGGVVGGSSAGASILGSYLVRGAPSSNNRIMSHPDYLTGFGFIRGTAIDQHVVARERLADLADSVISKHPHLLAISEDEGTAWVVRGDTGDIIGRSKAFVYGGSDANDPGKPFLTLWPGDSYDLAARRVLRRAIDGSPLTRQFVDAQFAALATPGKAMATVLVAHDGKVLINRAYGVPAQRRYMPETTTPNFALGGLSGGFSAAGVTPRTTASLGMGKTAIDTVTGRWMSNVDELYRLALGLAATAPLASDTYQGARRQRLYGTPEGKRNAFVRFPDQRAVIIVLSDNDAIDARAIADRIADRLLFGMSR